MHILTPALLHEDTKTAAELTASLEDMLTRWGFTTVFDIASVLDNTNLIRRRIASGEVKGPAILTVGEPFWVATPVYVRGFLAENHVAIPDVTSAAEARERVDRQVRDGADGVKIFADSVEQGENVTMPQELATAIAAEAHREKRPVFSHVSDLKGIDVSLNSGVDVLAHTTPFDNADWDAALVRRMMASGVALTPTLTLWEEESKKASVADVDPVMNKAAGQLQRFWRAGGVVLFGTDVGYIQQFDTHEEFKWMTRAGMSYEQILASLTTNPAKKFGRASHSGRIAKGMDADLTVLRSDPAKDTSAFANVAYTIRNGAVIYRAP